MTEEQRHEIVQRRQSGMSMRAIAEELGVSRGAVARALARVQAQRDGDGAVGSCRGRRHDREVERQILSSPSRPRQPTCQVSTPLLQHLARQLSLALPNSVTMAPFQSAINSRAGRIGIRRGEAVQVRPADRGEEQRIGMQFNLPE